MGRVTTHILDTARGCPAAGVPVELFALSGEQRTRLSGGSTNADGRCDKPLLDGEGIQTGVYEILFHVGAYLRARGEDLPTPAFLDVVPIRFGVASPDEHYHVPLLISPYGYSTYRGS